MNSSLWPLDTSSDGFWIVSTAPLVHDKVCFVLPHGYFWYMSITLDVFRLIQIWECALNWFIVEPIHKCLLNTSHLHGSGATYPKHVFSFCWSLCAKDPQLILKFAWHSSTTYPKHLLLKFLVGHVLVGVNPCGRCVAVALLPQIAKLPKKSQKNGFKICEVIWVCILPFFWMRVAFCHLEMFWVKVRSKNQP